MSMINKEVADFKVYAYHANDFKFISKEDILVSLSCTMCPDLVIAAQRIAAINPQVTAEVYDLAHFEQIKKQYNVMSVPCLVVNDDRVTFGKKNIQQLLEFLRQ